LKAQKRKHPAFEESTKPVFNKKSLSLPERIFVSKGHTWAELNPDGLAKVGVDEFVLKALGKIAVNNVVKEQTTVKQGDVVFEGNSGKGHFTFRSPIDGIVKEVNVNLKSVDDPYRKDWSLIIAPANWDTNIKNLKNGSALVSWLKENEHLVRLSYRGRSAGN
jgi:glycine cleavage system H protein